VRIAYSLRVSCGVTLHCSRTGICFCLCFVYTMPRCALVFSRQSARWSATCHGSLHH